MATIDDLDAKAFEVLEAIYESGGEANTSEIKEYTGIQKNAIIHYRYDRLEEAGLITTRTGESDSSRVPPKVAELTEEAGERIADGLFDEQDKTIVDRMDQMERQFRSVVDEFRDLEQEFRDWRYDEENDEELSAADLAIRMDELADMAETIEEAHDRLNTADDLDDRVTDLERKVTSYRQRVDDIELELSELQDNVENTPDQSDIEELRGKMATTNDMADVRSEQEDTQDELAKLERRIEMLEKHTRPNEDEQKEKQKEGPLSRLFRGDV
jgi:chromosome segregation ATPase